MNFGGYMSHNQSDLPQSNYDDDSIDLIDIFAVLLKNKWLIIITTLLSMLGVLLYAIISLTLPPETSYLPNKYTPKAHMLINDSSSSGGSLSSMLSSSGLGSLAGMAGISVPGGSTYSGLALFMAKSDSFLDTIIEKFNLIEYYKIEKHPKASSRKALKENLSVSFDDKSGVFSLSFTDKDPVFAQSVVNFAVDFMENKFTEMGLDKNLKQKENLEINIKNTYNEIIKLENESQKLSQAAELGAYTANGSSLVLESTRLKREISAQETIYAQLKTQYELVKVAMASESPVFQVLEYAEVPDQKSGPSRGMICIVVTFAGFFLSLFLAFLRNAIQNMRNNPETMNRLKGKN